MDPKLKNFIDSIRAKATALEQSEFAHLVKEDAVALYNDLAAALERIHEMVTAKPIS